MAPPQVFRVWKQRWLQFNRFWYNVFAVAEILQKAHQGKAQTPWIVVDKTARVVVLESVEWFALRQPRPAIVFAKPEDDWSRAIFVYTKLDTFLLLCYLSSSLTGGYLMKLASIRQFRTGISGFTRKGEMVIVTKSGKMVGCFLPLAGTHDIPIELKREFVTTLGGYMAAQLGTKKIQEKEVLDDFREFKKSRRRQ